MAKQTFCHIYPAFPLLVTLTLTSPHGWWEYLKRQYDPQMLYLEGHRQRLVAPPVWGQHGAQEVGAVRADQLPGMVRQHVRYIPGVRSRPERARVGHCPVALSNLAAGEGRGGRCKPSGRHVVYGKNHHNNRESSPKADVVGSEERTRNAWYDKRSFLFPLFRDEWLASAESSGGAQGGRETREAHSLRWMRPHTKVKDFFLK